MGWQPRLPAHFYLLRGFFLNYLARSAGAARGPTAVRKESFLWLTQHLPLQRAWRALGHAGLTYCRAYGAP